MTDFEDQTDADSQHVPLSDEDTAIAGAAAAQMIGSALAAARLTDTDVLVVAARLNMVGQVLQSEAAMVAEFFRYKDEQAANWAGHALSKERH